MTNELGNQLYLIKLSRYVSLLFGSDEISIFKDRLDLSVVLPDLGGEDLLRLRILVDLATLYHQLLSFGL